MAIGRYNFGEQPYGAAYLGSGIGEGLSEGGKNFVNAFLAVKQLKNQKQYADIYARQAHAAEIGNNPNGAVVPPNVPGSPNENLPGPSTIPGLQSPTGGAAMVRPGQGSPVDLASAPAQAKVMLTSMPPQAGGGGPIAPQPGGPQAAPPQAQALGTAKPGMATAQPVSTQAEEDQKWWAEHGVPVEEQEKQLQLLQTKQHAKDFHTRFKANATAYEHDEQSLSQIAAHVNSYKQKLQTLEPGSPEYRTIESHIFDLKTQADYHKQRMEGMQKSIYDLAIDRSKGENGYKVTKDPKTGQEIREPIYDEHLKPYLDWYFGKTEGVTRPGDRAIVEDYFHGLAQGKPKQPRSPMMMPGSGGRGGGSQRKMSGPVSASELASAQV